MITNDKILSIYSNVQKYDRYNYCCRFCYYAIDCRKTDSQTCLLKRDEQGKLDLLNLDVKGYKYVIMYQDHYRGNGKGFYFLTENYEKIKESQRFWFTNTDRPVHTVILTNSDIPTILAQRRKFIYSLQSVEFDIQHLPRPTKCFDGRKTRRTAPELYAAYDEEVNQYNLRISELCDTKLQLYAELGKIPKYSTTLYYININ